LLLFLAPLGCSDKAENTSPEAPPEEQPTPKPGKPEFVDKNTTMEENIGEEYPTVITFIFECRTPVRRMRFSSFQLK
jgi:hypothetical protein